MNEDRPAVLVDLPTSIRGFCYHDNEGESYIVLNARLTREQNLHTFDHEREHIDLGEMYDTSYLEYGGAS